MLILVVGIMFSCNDSTTKVDVNDASNIKDEYAVEKTLAEKIAENMVFVDTKEDLNNISLRSAKKVKKEKGVKSMTEVPDKNNKTAYYIINYEEGGFIILAGDKRSEPILAFSETGSFNINTEDFPAGLVSWLYSTKENVEKIRDENLEISPQIVEQWNDLQKGGADVISCRQEQIEDDPDCTPYTIQKGPFLRTTWHQKCGFNSETPEMSCSKSDRCGHALAGCAAIAMAQVMKFYQYPTSYNWANMPNTQGSTSTATLIRDIGDAVGMNYGCDGSSVSPTKITPAFKNDFGYSSASYADYNYQTVENELDHDRPVILTGGRKSGWWIFSSFKDGHGWVCDGYIKHVIPCYGTMLMFHMNWGWVETEYNAWYNFNNFNPGEDTYNYENKMIYNIKP